MSRVIRPLLICATAATMLLGVLAPSVAAVEPEVSQPSSPPADLLPDLQLEPLGDFRVQVVDGRRVLRLTARIANRGDGPLELAGTRSGTANPELAIVQHIYQPDGSYVPVESAAVLGFSADNRNQWKLVGAAEYTLKVPGDPTPRVTHSVDLCLADENRLIGEVEARGFGCLDGRPDGRAVTQGLSVGWSNSDRSYERSQRIDLTGLPLPGQYCVTAAADPRQLLTEKSRENNGASTLVDIASNGVTVVAANC
jgi:hypothetical protein